MSKMHGMALVMVLWLVAAMSLLVATVVYIARADVKQQQLFQEQIQASAEADKMMRLSMRTFIVDTTENGYSMQLARQYALPRPQGEARVEIFPASGLVHLGSVSPELLLSMLQFGLMWDEQKLGSLGELLSEGFTSASLDGDRLGLPSRFRVLEDLLLIPGVTIDDLDRLKDYLYVGPQGAPGINPGAAPKELLLVLAGGDESAVEEFVSTREVANSDPDEELLPHARFTSDLISSADSMFYRVDVTLSSAKRAFAQRYWIMLTPGPDGVPWHLHSRDPIRVGKPAAAL